MIQSCATKLLSGVDGHIVMDELRKHYKSLHSLDSISSKVRQRVIAQGRSELYDDTALRRFDNEEAVQLFLNAPLKEQCAIRRSYLWRTPPFSDEAANELQKIQLLPTSLDTFHMGRIEMIELKRRKEIALLKKNETLIVITDAEHLLKIAIQHLHSASPSSSDATLILPLLLVSGRRTAEICNGKSVFTPSDIGPTYCTFDGQLKTKSEVVQPYVIPLLVDFSLFKRGLDVWFQKHGMRDATKSNIDAAAIYSSNIGRDRMRILPLPATGTVHTLRSIYIQMVWNGYQDIPYTFSRLAMACLGHSSMQESLSYSNVKLINADSIKLGKMLI